MRKIKGKRRIKGWYSVGILIAAMITIYTVLLFSHQVQAKNKTIIKVGYFELGSYNKISQEGEMNSFDAAYLREIESYTDYTFQFVDCGTWMNAIKMLKNKEIQLIGTTQWNAQREEQLEFCLENYGYTIGEIVTLPEKSVAYEDYKAIGKMKIGVLYNYVQLNQVKQQLKKNHINPEIITYKTFQEVEDALKEGKVDAIIGNSHMLEQDWTVIEKFSYNPMYFISWKGNTLLTDELDKALIQINLQNPLFDDEMVAKYFPGIDQNALTKEEQDYIDSLDNLSFCFCTNEGYLCRTENGKYVGIHPTMAKEICKKLGVKYKEVQFDFPRLIQKLSAVKDGKGKAKELVDEVRDMGIDIWGDFFYSQSWAQTLGVDITSPYLDASYYEIKRKGESFNPKKGMVAAVQGLRYTTEIVNRYKASQIVWCKDFGDCVKAVKSGKADMTVINTLAAEYYLSMFQYNDLNATLIEFTNQSCMAVVADDSELLTSILNKTMHSISENQINTIVKSETAKAPKQNMLFAFFYSHMLATIMVLIIVAMGIVALICMVYITLKSRKQNTILTKATNAKSDFLARMSHDIRTPLNVIIGMSHMAQENENPAETQDSLEKIDLSSQFLLGLVNDVLDMEHIESGKIELQPAPYSSSEFKRYIDTVIQPLCQNKNIHFSYEENADGEYNIIQDKLRINQIHFNLLSNAVKYTEEGGEISLILKISRVAKNRVVVNTTISDTGIGMSEEFQEHMFEAFTQENQIMTSVSQGSGLGLAIVKRLCDAMGIAICVESKLGEGTTYHLRGEYEIIAIDEEQMESKGNVEIEDFDSLKGKRILVCEDHMLNQQIIKKVLEKQGIIPIIVEDGQKGVDTFLRSTPWEYAAVLMDIRMPIMDGIKATKEIRKSNRPDAKTIPIIALTANAYASDMERTKEAGMNEHLSKPINPTILYQTLRVYI